MDVRRGADWVISQASISFPAVAARAAPHGGQSHFLTHVSASYDAASVTGALQIVAGADVIWIRRVHGSLAFAFYSPLRIGPGQAVSVQLSGDVVEGRVNAAGYTL